MLQHFADFNMYVDICFNLFFNLISGISGLGEHSYVGSDKVENEGQGEDGGTGRQQEKEEEGEEGDGKEDNDKEEEKEGGGKEEEEGGVVNEGNGHEGEDYSAYPSWLQRKGVGIKNYKEV